jgi:hypothetical protein
MLSMHRISARLIRNHDETYKLELIEAIAKIKNQSYRTADATIPSARHARGGRRGTEITRRSENVEHPGPATDPVISEPSRFTVPERSTVTKPDGLSIQRPAPRSIRPVAAS